MHKRLQQGFTIVELLIVVVVIGVLAAIVIVAYNGITASAHETAVRADLSNFAKKVEVYKVQNGAYPSGTAQLDSMQFSVTEGSYDQTRNNFYYCPSADLTEYAVGVETVTDVQYYMVNGTTGPGSSLSYANTCAELSPAGTGGNMGHDSAGTGWANWTQ